MLVTRELVNLSHQQQQKINALKSTCASLPANHCRRMCQSGLASWPYGLMEALVSFVMGMIASAKNNTNMA
jgi:hypothetical protein